MDGLFRPAKDSLRVDIRWMIKRDHAATARMDAATYADPWCEEEFVARQRQRHCVGMVAEHDGRVVGYMMYELHPAEIRLLRLVVHPDCRGRGVGAQMVNKLKSKLSESRRRRVQMDVRETNLSSLQFLRSQRFLARRVLRNHFGDTGEDGFSMCFDTPGKEAPRGSFQ